MLLKKPFVSIFTLNSYNRKTFESLPNRERFFFRILSKFGFHLFYIYGGKRYNEIIGKKFIKEVLENEETQMVVDGIDVVVKGIVGPSVVNKNGFYLFGEDGSMIAVLVNSVEEFVGLEIGHEIILKGMRERYVDDDSATWAGQTCIVNAEILVNNYGNTAYSTAKFVTDKTLADFYALDGAVDYSTTVFVLKATVSVEKNELLYKFESHFGNDESFLVLFRRRTVRVVASICRTRSYDRNYSL